jgi:hypothetical protein
VDKLKHFAALPALLGAVLAMDVHACTIPVFRYALERWPAAAYELHVLYRGALAEDLRQCVDAVVPADARNLVVVYHDLDGDAPEGALRQSWERDPKSDRLPLGVLLTPPELGDGAVALWEGTLTPSGVDDLRRLIHAPVVRQAIRSLCEGSTAVWLIADGPDEKLNRSCQSSLEQRLAALSKELKLPHELDPLDEQYDAQPAPGIPLQIAFSVQRVAMDAPASSLLKGCLNAWDAERVGASRPLIVPVFGRGRALGLFTPEDLTDEVLKEVCGFLVGECSCRIKEINPGFDLLMPFAWDRALWDTEYNVKAAAESLGAKPARKQKVQP